MSVFHAPAVQHSGACASPRRIRAITHAVVISTVVALAGCGTSPIVRWDVPKKADVPDYTLAYGITYANRARDAYRDAIRNDTDASRSLSSGLITLGAAIAGLAAFKAHRDTVVGAGLIGGTALALGNWNFSKQRLIIYQAGVGGINCSIEAVMPLYISSTARQHLGTAVATLNASIDVTVKAVAVLRTAISEGKGSADERTKAEALIKPAQDLIAAARASAQSAQQFLRASDQAGPALVAAVDRISHLIDKAVLDTLPDISSVPKVVAGLAGLAGSFAPGSGLDGFISDALKNKFGKAESGKVIAEKSTIANEVLGLLSAQDSLASAMAVVNGDMAGRDAAANTAKLADCGLAGVDTALKVAPTRVRIKTKVDSSSAVRASGGSSAVYSGVFLDAPEGLTVKNPLAGDRTITVVGSKTLTQTGEYTLVVTDAAAKEVSITVVVENAEKTGEPAPAGTDKSGAAKALAKWFTDNRTLKFKDTEVTVKDATASDGGDVNATIACAPPQPFTNEDALAAFKTAYGTQATVQTALGKQVAITFKGETESCVKSAGKAESRRADDIAANVDGRKLRPNEIIAVQRNLCMANEHQIGIWGPRTIAAFTAWRSKNGRKTGPPTSMRKDEFDALGAATPAQCPA